MAASTAEDGEVRVDVEAGVAVVTLDRPPRNALTVGFTRTLISTLDGVATDRRVRAVVLTGAGDTFCAGADLLDGPDSVRRLLTDDGGGRPGYREPAARIGAAIARLPVPVIAAINGDAAGGGATIPLAADVRFAAGHARFVFPFTRLGLCPEGASTHHLPRLVGPGRAADWLLSGRRIDADEALAAGLVSRVLPADRLLDEAVGWARQVATKCAPTAVAATRALLAAAPATPDAAAEAESATIVTLAAGPDCAEGVAAFAERRAPRFGAADTPARTP
ncbi:MULTISPECIES: enoyl-CoA hydratase/isomerase family protein [Pseudonocardia]|uniref:2,3-dehydroadipyl-CoA hydratase n=2 Tax=Pseudonocardia TaxID=1847 RepID=A0A1Y2N3G2_PSEAH|nr:MULTISPECIES: enoyl-CoA hydratase-related protein [Pseudonocardia]OSY42016.1 2,3-dehydroadipyl-CoA hydratase [Pseudonocardia autotrophica]TDN75215.1 enoyl-CoA hydratase/carnithine racemase [Pseudonocardia autotrophica]BBF99160.1 enoyl-CoA hydratase [Pseudonocardia autotrophica]GEC28587.1 enoyl-CoA hydratase [Pseudonocardia saturnea]